MTGPGRLLGDRYQLERRIATGGMGEVWRATDTLLGRLVAVKVLKNEYADDADFLERFRLEARHTAALSHPGIANVFDYGEVTDDEGRTDTAFLVMELVDGEPLSALLSREGSLPPEQVLDVVAQAGAALQAAHDAGVVHRDVKPGNLLVRPDGVVKVTDFGIARATDSASLTAVGTVLGTAYYLSPEQAAGGSVTHASDVYALGVVAFEALAGERPFRGDNPMAVGAAHVREPVPPLPDGVPDAVRGLVGAMLAKAPEDRPSSAGEVARRARRLRDGMTDDLAATGAMDPPTARTTAIPPVSARRDGTRMLPPVGAAAAGATTSDATTQHAAAGTGYDRGPQPTRAGSSSGGRSGGAGTGVVVALVVAVLALVVVALLLANRDRAPQVAVPDVLGSTLQQAEATLTGAGLDVDTEDVSPEDAPAPFADAAEGTVVEQDPAGGSEVDEGDTVTLGVLTAPEEEPTKEPAEPIREPSPTETSEEPAEPTAEPSPTRTSSRPPPSPTSSDAPSPEEPSPTSPVTVDTATAGASPSAGTRTAGGADSGAAPDAVADVEG